MQLGISFNSQLFSPASIQSDEPFLLFAFETGKLLGERYAGLIAWRAAVSFLFLFGLFCPHSRQIKPSAFEYATRWLKATYL